MTTTSSHTTHNYCLIDRNAIQHNLSLLRQKLSPNTHIMGIVKANAYGLNAIEMAKLFESIGIEMIGVAYTQEGANLKEAGISAPIFILHANEAEIPLIIEYNLEVAVTDAKMIQKLGDQAKTENKTVKVHLHIDTGMKRLGCDPEDALSLAKLTRDHPGLSLHGIMTHLSSADTPEDDPFTMNQVRTFEHCVQEIEQAGISIPWKHVSNSSASIRFQFDQFNLARVGIALYGLVPSTEVEGIIPLQSAVKVTSRIAEIHHCKAGDTISYNRTYRSHRDQQRIAVLPFGYADGMHGTYVMIHGMKAPVIGKICMDFTVVDIDAIPEAEVGDEVLIYNGKMISEIANEKNIPIYQLLTSLGGRVLKTM